MNEAFHPLKAGARVPQQTIFDLHNPQILCLKMSEISGPGFITSSQSPQPLNPYIERLELKTFPSPSLPQF